MGGCRTLPVVLVGATLHSRYGLLGADMAVQRSELVVQASNSAGICG